MKKYQLFLLTAVIAIVFFASRLWGIGSGLNLLEPDEWDYQNISQSFSQSWIPTWKGEPYLEKFPLFVFIGFILDRLLHVNEWVGPYANLRLISVISNGFTAFLLWLMLKKKVDKNLSWVAILLFLLTPVILFYSKVGTLDSFASFFAVIVFLVIAQSSTHKLRKRRVLGIGLLLGLAILAKQINLILFSIPVFVFIYEYVKGKKIAWEYIQAMIISFVFLGIVSLGLNLLQGQVDSRQMLNLGERLVDFSPKRGISQLLIYFQRSGYWLSWPVIIWLFLGNLMFIFKKEKKQKKILWMLVGFFIGWASLLAFYGRVTPRNLFFGVPFLFLGSILGYSGLSKSWRTKSLLFTCFVLVLSLPFSVNAWQSGFHASVEKAAQEVKRISQKESLPVYATFDQEKISQIAGDPVSLLTAEATESGIVLIDERKTELILAFTEKEFQEAKLSHDWIEDNSQPVWELIDPWPHFPGTDKGNKFMIYKFSNE